MNPTDTQSVQSEVHACYKCRQPISDAHLLLADNQYWHEDCLRCACCDVRLAEVDKVCYVKAKMPLCRRDYLRLYGQTGQCVACRKRICAFEFVMRIQDGVYHLNCFCCQRCQLRFCVGDKFYVQHKFILCESDYIERLRVSNTSLLTTTPVIQPGELLTMTKTSMLQFQRTSVPSSRRSGKIRSKKCLSATPSLPTFLIATTSDPFRFECPNSDTDANGETRRLVLSRSNYIPDDHSSGYGSPISPTAMNIDIV